MKNYLSALFIGSLLVSSASAAEHKLPEKGPVISFTFPEKWKAEKFDEGVEATTEDEEVYIAVENIGKKGVEASMEAAIKYLKEKGVTAKNESLKTEEAKLNGMDVVNLSWDGKDEDGDCKISVVVVAATDDKGVLIIYWASPEGEKKNQAELTKFMQSMKPLKGEKAEEKKGEEKKADEKKPAKEEKEEEEEK